MSDEEAKTVAGIGLALSLWTIGWLIYRRFWTCEVRHRWEVVHAFKVSDYREHFVGWRGERRCKRKGCGKYEVILSPRATEKDLAR